LTQLIPGAGCIKLFIIFILKSMAFPAIWLVHRSAISARIALLAMRFVLKSHLLSTNHIRVLNSANQSYLIIGFKQPIKFKKNVIRQMSKKQTNYICYDLKFFLYSWVPKQFFANKKQNNMDSYCKLSKNCKEFSIFLKFQRQNANKSKFKASGQTQGKQR
jgi:hypothetical protein